MPLRIMDCTLREGDQAAGVWLDAEDKRVLFRLLDAAGVAIVDAGMPAVSEAERALLRELASTPGRTARVAASVRCRTDELELAAGCGVDEVYVIYPVSRLHREQRLRLDRNAWRERGLEVLDAARAHGLPACLVLEDASRADPADIATAMEVARDARALRVMLCDTVGVLTPARAAELTRFVLGLSGGIEVGTHFHDDFGMATANTIAAIDAGASVPSVTVNGVGERAGNAELAAVTLACDELLRRPTGVRREHLLTLSREVERRTGVLRAPNAPIVGQHTHRHESGIHVHGLLSEPRTYESVDPGPLGAEREIVFGKHSGHAGLRALAVKHGLPEDPALLERVLARVKNEQPEGRAEATARFLEDRDRYLATRGVTTERVLAIFGEEIASTVRGTGGFAA